MFMYYVSVSSNSEDLPEGPRVGFSFLRNENVAGTACDTSFPRND